MPTDLPVTSAGAADDMANAMAEAWIAWQCDLWRPWFELWNQAVEAWPALAWPLAPVSMRGTEQLA
jgi:hypothetical protein